MHVVSTGVPLIVVWLTYVLVTVVGIAVVDGVIGETGVDASGMLMLGRIEVKGTELSGTLVGIEITLGSEIAVGIDEYGTGMTLTVLLTITVIETLVPEGGLVPGADVTIGLTGVLPLPLGLG